MATTRSAGLLRPSPRCRRASAATAARTSPSDDGSLGTDSSRGQASSSLRRRRTRTATSSSWGSPPSAVVITWTQVDSGRPSRLEDATAGARGRRRWTRRAVRPTRRCRSTCTASEREVEDDAARGERRAGRRSADRSGTSSNTAGRSRRARTGGRWPAEEMCTRSSEGSTMAHCAVASSPGSKWRELAVEPGEHLGRVAGLERVRPQRAPQPAHHDSGRAGPVRRRRRRRRRAIPTATGTRRTSRLRLRPPRPGT